MAGFQVTLHGRFRLTPEVLQQALQDRTQRSVVYVESFARAPLDGAHNGFPVQRSRPQRAQNQHVEGALQQLHRGRRRGALVVSLPI